MGAAASLVMGATLALTGTGSANAAATAGTAYVALGDSYSSGVGSGSYDSASGDCKRSSKAYPVLWANSHAPSSFSFTACSGAVTGDVINKQLAPLNSSTTLVSISIGGNDAGFADVMTTCILSSDSGCIDRVNQARSYVSSTLPGRLDAAYNAIRAKAPNARVVVLGYPRFYKIGGSCIVGISDTKRSAINNASDLLNSVISQRVAAHSGFTFANVASRFSGHEICSGDAWLHSVNWLNIGESYHPTASGQSGGYLPALNAVS
ncbi:SGNH/GDSL hydrolase family protein [Streptomyces palmae]|uniref:triacylglycerol lipase n=1 Tax=Streptomyces palmae TaxID=1701085 RepID=A0A4Z0GHN0_9ACTN|nr:SGNH/GDSL hydrolase family protein [Streptomyces palmae]